MSKLFTALQVGNCQLQHRVIMAPLTRFRAEDNHVQMPIAREYYSQRASVPGTLLITEATLISPRGSGYNNVPGIWNADQIKAWKDITDAVHAKKSFIYLQLWALGRAALPDAVKSTGGDLVSSSAVPMSDNSPTPRELTEAEIQLFISDYAQAAKNAIEAGFDGVEIHGANGYLIDQFTQDTCNKRTDAWGGSVEKRARFALEVARAVVEAVGADKVGMRLSPFSSFQGMKMEDPLPTFTYLANGLKDLKLAYLHVVESRIDGNADVEPTQKINFLVDIWDKTSPIFAAGGFKPDSAKRAVDEEYTDKDMAIVFGRYFISNPDLAYRIKENVPLAPYNRDTFYKAKSTEGYTDYPFSKGFEAKL